MFRLLHISDLHRSVSDPVGNAELISTLVADHDRQRCDATPIGDYEAAIVSGDIVQGVGLGHPDHDTELRAQYQVAYEFLAELAGRFFSGDHSKIVLVPGNHDINWNAARESMELVDKPDVPLKKALSTPNTPFRWDWDSRQLYRIKDFSRYDQRLKHYLEFRERFYAGSSAPVYADPNGYFDLFELCDQKIIVAAFNSCHNNDCFRDQGSILEDAIARAHLTIRDRGRPYFLKIAVWHHSIAGPPGLSDYMDVSLVRRMIDRGFRVGFHGHQHSTEVVNQHISLPQQTDMVVISAGSLCAGQRELPAGIQRQYNVVEISESFDSCRVHVREVTSANVFVPSSRFVGSVLEARWTPERDEVGRPVDQPSREVTALIISAEQAARTGDPTSAFQLLRPQTTALTEYGRRLLLQCAVQIGEWSAVLAVAKPDISVEDLVTYIDAAIRLGKFDDASVVLDRNAGVVELGAAEERDLRNRIATKRMIKNG